MSDQSWNNSKESVAQFVLAQTDCQSWDIFPMVKCLQTTQHKAYQKPAKDASCKPADLKQIMQSTLALYAAPLFPFIDLKQIRYNTSI